MQDRVYIKEKDLVQMMQVLDIKEIPGTGLIMAGTIAGAVKMTSASMGSQPGGDADIPETQEYCRQMESLLLSLMIIQKSTHRLIVKPGQGFLYEYRNFYLVDNGIVVLDKKRGSECVCFTLVPYITLAVGAVSDVGAAKTEYTVSARQLIQALEEKIIRITEISPNGDEEYNSECIPGHEPLEIERMMRFLIYAHQECMKGATDYV